VRGGPVRLQADEVLDLLHDPTRCQVVLVTLPETTPVNEVVQTAYALEDRVGVRLGPVIVNNVDRAADGTPLPDLSAAALRGQPQADLLRRAAAFRSSRRAMQDDEIARLGLELALEQWHLPQLPVAGMGPADVADLASAIHRAPPRDPA